MNQALEVNEGNFSDPNSFADSVIRSQYGFSDEGAFADFLSQNGLGNFGRAAQVLDKSLTIGLRGFNRDLHTQLLNAQYDRITNASEAQKQRVWEEMMSNTAFRRQMEDLKAAGINPLYMFMGSGSGASTPSGASSSYSSSVNPKSKDISKILSSLIMAMGRIIAGVL